MAEKFFWSDQHFFHSNILKFTDAKGALIRGSRFSSVEEMNEAMVENYNKLVRSQDKVYFLGDVAVGVQHQSLFTDLLRHLPGHKRLYLGNHDNIHQPAYKYFERIELWSGGKFKDQNFVCSHIPLRGDQMRDGEFNVHGHIHHNTVMMEVGADQLTTPKLAPDPQYICVCVEHTDYRPVHMDEILERIEKSR